MMLQLLIGLSPFIAVLYALFALIQALRHKQQGWFAALLALIAVALPLAGYLVAGALVRTRMMNLLTLSAGIVFVASLLMLLIERGNKKHDERRNVKRDPRRSYGMLGIGVSLCLALITFAAPVLSEVEGNTPTDSATNVVANQTLRNVAFQNPDAQGTSEPGATDPSASAQVLAQVLGAQTGLTPDEVTTQVEGGSTIAALVQAHNGDLDAVIAAFKTELDNLVAEGGRNGQLLTRLGTDTTQVATQLVNGELGQAQNFLLPRLLGGQSAIPGAGNFNGAFPNRSPQATPETTAEPLTMPDATTEATDEAAPTAVAQALTAQTGLTTDEITTQVEGGSTIADLVSANDGDLDAVITAIAGALDDLSTEGGFGAQMLSRLGSDTTQVATQLVNGELGQAQNFLLPGLISGNFTPPQLGGRGGNGGAGGEGGTANFQPLINGTPPANGGFLNGNFNNANVTQEAPNNNSNDAPPQRPTQAATQAAPLPPSGTPTAVPTLAIPTATPAPPTATVERPTRIVFPTATPTLEATSASSAASTDEASTNSTNSGGGATLSGQTCGVIVDYNLNLRDKPTTEGSTILVSIPFGSTINADAHNSDDWYHVAYDGKVGWVSGQYVTASAACDSLPTAP